MTDTLLETPPGSTRRSLEWHRVCRVDDLEPAWGEAALVQGRQVALFRVGADELYAVSNRDPVTGAHVIARGITGSTGDRVTVAAPLHKQIYDLATGACLSAPELHLRTYPTRVVEGCVEVGIAA